MKRSILIAVAAVLLSAVPAMADTYAIGDPVIGNSWSDRFQADNHNQFDLIALRIFSPAGGSFEAPGMTNFTSDWHVIGMSGDKKIVAATGTAAYSIQFTALFNGTPSDGIGFDAVLFEVGKNEPTGYMENGYYGSNALKYNKGWTWNYPIQGGPITRSDVMAAVPAPAAIGLGVLGLGLVGWVKRRMA